MQDLFNESIQNIKRAHIIYFTGTGGTARVSSQFEESLTSHGIEVQKAALDMQEAEYCTLSTNIQKDSLLILIFAVHAFDAPEPVYDWINAIPDGIGRPAVVISVSGGGEVWPNTACRAGCIKLLERKGYNVFYERMMVMPSNILVATKDQLAIRLLQVLPTKAENCASEILSGVRRRRRAPIMSRIMTAIFKSEKKWAKKFPEYLRIGETCTGCGWCLENCPRKNIELVNSRPSFGGQCVACLRCIYGCPYKSIYIHRIGFITIKEGYDLDELEQRMSGVALEPIEKIKAGILFIGVRDYLLNKDV
ncbi:MAG TPA: EFR1 family ferrodoxin [Bacillota bacterium]|nr:EFR1 family ferrodoxin [Bacillota bacterium]